MKKASGLNSPLVHVVLVAALGLLTYSNTFEASFHLDDHMNIVDNPAIKDLSYFMDPSSARAPLGAMSAELYQTFRRRPVGFLGFALNYRAHGLDLAGYHAVNLSVHLLNAALLYLLLVLAFRTPRLGGSSLAGKARLIALCTALLFVAHPVQTQAVTYISQRFASLAALFCLLSLVSYTASRLSARKAARYAMYAISVLSALLAMKTKENAFTLPLVIAVFEFMFFEGDRRRRLLLLLPLLLTMLVIPLGMMDLERPLGESLAGGTRMQEAPPQGDYLITQFRVMATYLRLLLLPVNQNLDYDYPVFRSLFEQEVLLSLLLVASVLGAGVYLLRRSRRGDAALSLCAFGIFWFFLALSVESSLIALADVMFEHRLYLPSAGAFILMSTGGFLLTQRRGYRTAAAILTGATIAALLIGTYGRNTVWRDNISLLEDSVAKSPGKARVHTNLGQAYMARGLNDKAARRFLAALELNPSDHLAHYNLGVLYRKADSFKEAIRHYEAAIRLSPSLYDAYYELGLIYLAQGEKGMARREFETVLKMNPAHYWARKFLMSVPLR